MIVDPASKLIPIFASASIVSALAVTPVTTNKHILKYMRLEFLEQFEPGYLADIILINLQVTTIKVLVNTKQRHLLIYVAQQQKGRNN